MEKFEFHSSQSHSELINGEMRTQVKEVHAKNGKGSVTVRYLGPKGNVLAEHSEELAPVQIRRIKDKRFVPDLFDRCLINCGNVAAEQTPRNATKLRRMAHAFSSRRRTRRNN